MSKAPVSEGEILYMLSLAFIEIRASDDLNKAQAIADIFHNVPSRIASKADPFDTYESINARSARLDMEDEIESWWRLAEKFSG